MNKDGKKKLEIEEEIQEEDIYSNFIKNEENSSEKEEKKDDSLSKNIDNDKKEDTEEIKNDTPENNVGAYQYREKEYKTNTLKEHTKITKASKASRIILFGFYALVVVIGALAILMIRDNKYEFYLKQEEVEISVGSSYQVELIPKDIRYFDYLKYNYTIADESVASVDEYGTVTTKKAGKTTLRIGLRPGLTSKVMQIVSSSIDIDDLDIGIVEKDNLKQVNMIDLGVDHSVTVKAIVNNENDINVTATFTSSDESVVTVDDFGNVTAVGEGETTIKGELDGVVAEIPIVVTKDPISTSLPKETKTKIVKIDLGVGDKVSKYVNDSIQLTPTTEPNNVKGATIKWTSSDTKVATVSNNGLIKCLKEGRTTITAAIDGVKASVIVVVENKPTKTLEEKVQKIDLGVSKEVTKYVNDQLQLYPKIEPSNVKSATIKWTSSDTKVATVSNNGLIKCLKEGSATITATIDGVKASLNVKVKNKEREKVTKITFGMGDKYTTTVKDKFTVSPTITPKTATGYTIKWTSSDTKVATVNNGKVECLKAGTTTISAEADGVRASFKLTVNGIREKVKKINLGVAESVTKLIGESLKITPTVEPKTATGYGITWESINPKVATIKDGLIKCISKGNSTITAEIKEDNVKASVEVLCREKETIPKGSQFGASQIKLDKTELTVENGKTAKFAVTVTNAAGTLKITSSSSSVATITMPSGDICKDNICFFDGIQKGDTLEFVVNGKKAGTAYINVSNVEIYGSDANITEIKGTGKVGILVK